MITEDKQTIKQLTVFLGFLLKDGKILLNLRNDNKLPEAHLKWELPGGKCEWNETPQMAIKREFLEETGIHVNVKELFPYVQTNFWKYAWGIQQTFCFIFLCEYISEIERPFDPNVETVEWFNLDEIQGLETLPGVKEIIDVIKAKPYLIAN